MAYTSADNNYATAKFIVGTSGKANYLTIATAITAALAATGSQTIFILPGVYTENLTLQPSVNLVAYDADALTPNVTITGKLTFTQAGTVSISGIRLTTNSDFFLAVTGSAASVVNMKNCYLNCLNNTGISFTASNTSAVVQCNNCGGNLGTTGIAFHSMSSTGSISYQGCGFDNSGASTTVTSNSAGDAYFFYCTMASPIGTTSTGGIFVLQCNVDVAGQNVTALTSNGTGNNTAEYSLFNGGSASAVTVGTGVTLLYLYCAASSSNATAAITGLGAIQTYCPTFPNSNFLINTTTQSTGGTIQGLRAGNAPNAGFIGEQLSNAVTGTVLGNGTITDLTSISLTPGIWDVTGMGVFTFTGTALGANLGVSLTSVTLAGNNGDQNTSFVLTSATPTVPLSVSSFRIVRSTTATCYLVVQGVYSTGAVSCSGRISATRVG